MIVLKYRRIDRGILPMGEFYMLEQISDGSADNVRVELPDGKSSELIIAGKRHRIREGACTVPFSDIPDGIVEPEVHREGVEHPATPFLKTGNGILRSPTDEAALMQLRSIYLELEERLRATESRISDIELKIRPHGLFDFN